MTYEKVAIAGAAGLTGMHFINRLTQRGDAVRAIVRSSDLRDYQDRVSEVVRADLTDLDQARAAFQGCDAMIMSAAYVVGAKVAVENPMAVVSGNIILATRMLEAAALEGIKRVLLIGSSTTYPAVDRAVSEDEWDEPPASVYQGIGNVKRFQETLARFYHDKYGMEVAIIRAAPVYGEFDNFHPEHSHVIPALIRRAISGESPFVVWGTGHEVRDFVHADDVARAGLLALDEHAVCDPLNVGGGQPYTIGEVARTIMDLVGRVDDPIEFDPSKPTTIPYRMLDNTKIGETLGFKPAIKLEEGLRRTIDWYRQTSA